MRRWSSNSNSNSKHHCAQAAKPLRRPPSHCAQAAKHHCAQAAKHHCATSEPSAKMEFEFQCRSLKSFHARCASCGRKSSSNSNSIFANRPPPRAMRARMILGSDKMAGTFRNGFDPLTCRASLAASARTASCDAGSRSPLPTRRAEVPRRCGPRDRTQLEASELVRRFCRSGAPCDRNPRPRRSGYRDGSPAT
jgi:hypothetical protein